VPVEPAASEKPTPSLIEVPPAEQGDLVLLGEQQSAPPAVPAEPESVAPAEEPASAASPATAPGLVNVNTADLQALIDLPGIGPALARRIIAYREANGSFTSVDQLIDIQGIGTRNIDEFRHLVTVE
jgi:competence protein ComEA